MNDHWLVPDNLNLFHMESNPRWLPPKINIGPIKNVFKIFSIIKNFIINSRIFFFNFTVEL